MRTYVYVDTFNLYYGALKGTPHKWLNIAKLCDMVLKKNDIQRIKCFSALVSARDDDSDLPMRQQTYFRALRTDPRIELIYGQFKLRVRSGPLVRGKKNEIVRQSDGKPKIARTLMPEEKVRT